VGLTPLLYIAHAAIDRYLSAPLQKEEIAE
jgi:hypothetical protein